MRPDADGSALFEGRIDYIEQLGEVQLLYVEIGRGGEPLVAKFYRPGRWTREAVLEEHAFAHELADAELPVVAPLRIDGDTLHHWAGFDFALFPLRGGRAPEAGDRATLVRLGTLLGRLHAVGARGRFAHRGALTPTSHGREPLAFLLAGDWMPRELAGNVARIGHALLDAVEARQRAARAAVAQGPAGAQAPAQGLAQGPAPTRGHADG